METDEGRQRYRLRKQTVETGFGIIKAVQGFRSFLLRGVERVCTEWTLVTLAYNSNKRLHTLRLVQQRQGRAGSGSRSGKRSLEGWIASPGRQNVGLQTALISRSANMEPVNCGASRSSFISSDILTSMVRS